MKFWISWEQPTEDYRPLTFPPNENILGWWCSGETMDGIYILCSIVIANNKEEAEKHILKDWPEAKNWRFCEQKEDNWKPSDRFPLSDWMTERIKPYGIQKGETNG